jgi:hypothetical protein
MEIEAVQEPVGVSLDVPVLLSMRKQREQSMACVVGVYTNFPGLPFTPPDIEVLDGSELGPSDVLGCLSRCSQWYSGRMFEDLPNLFNLLRGKRHSRTFFTTERP